LRIIEAGAFHRLVAEQRTETVLRLLWSDGQKCDGPDCGTAGPARRIGMSSVTIPPPDSHLRVCAASNQCERSTHGLTALQAERRFGIGRVVLAKLCRRNPGLGVQEPARDGKAGWHWVIDPPRLGQVLGDALDPAQLAQRFGVPIEDFASLDPPRRAMLAAVLPLPDRPRQHRSSPLVERAGVGHARD
jgi:hypothetical protein